MIKVSFEDILKMKDDDGKHSPLVTLFNIVDLNNMFSEVLKINDSVMSDDSEVAVWLCKRLTLMDTANYKELGSMFKILDCLAKYATNKKRIREYSSLIIPYMIMEAYRTYKPLIGPLGITMPVTKCLVASDELIYKLWIDYNNDMNKKTYKFGVKAIPNLEAERILFGIAKGDKELTPNDIHLIKSMMYGQVLSILRNEHKRLISIKEKENEQLVCDLKRSADTIDSRDKRIKKLEQKIITIQSNSEIPAVKKEIVVNNNYYKDEFDKVQLDNFELSKKLSALQYRVHLMEKIISNDGTNTNDKILEEELFEISEATNIDISNYKILVLADKKRCRGSEFKILDCNGHATLLSACDHADVVVCMIHYITHSAYYGVKSYCKMHGITFIHCNENTSDMKKFDESIRQSVMNCLIE